MDAYSLMKTTTELSWFVVICFTAFLIVAILVIYGRQFILEFRMAKEYLDLFLMWVIGLILFIVLLGLACMYYMSFVMIYFEI